MKTSMDASAAKLDTILCRGKPHVDVLGLSPRFGPKDPLGVVVMLRGEGAGSFTYGDPLITLQIPQSQTGLVPFFGWLLMIFPVF
jgi:hypothetical protein